MLNYRLFDPTSSNQQDIPQSEGNYIICLRRGSKLPETNPMPIYNEYNGLKVLYTGISSNIQKRDYCQHFNGNAGSSTLRKSIGSIFGYSKVPRDKKTPQNGKTKFLEADEARLSEWMHSNLLLFYVANNDSAAEEQQQIDTFNPPLNLSKNSNPSNREFRALLKSLRKQK